MQNGKMNFIIDQSFGSSGKGKVSSYLADINNVTHVSSSNFPNAGHSVVDDNGDKFIAKALPTACFLKKMRGFAMNAFVSPGSGFSWGQVKKEWEESGRPNVFIHDRANIVNESHKKREMSGSDSTKHIASTMQGTAAAMTDKILRRPEVELARSEVDLSWSEGNVQVLDSMSFRDVVHGHINSGKTWLHEGSQGYALSIDHGPQYPHTTSRNCTLQSYMDHMAIPPSMVGDVYMNLRTFPIRVGNVVESGVQKGYSGDFYSDSRELTWAEVAGMAGMPEEEAEMLLKRELTTVTKRLRRVSTFSWIGLQDAVRVNGATKMCVNFIQYLNWKDAGLKGGKESFEKLSKESRAFIAKVEEVSNIPVVLVGTGEKHGEVINLT